MILLKRLRYLPVMVFTVLAFISCDDDFNGIGGELVGGEGNELPRYEAGIVAYNLKMPPVQTNNLPAHLLGVYDEPIYGRQTANILTQLSLSANDPSFGNEPRLDSVVLTLPYYSTEVQDVDGDSAYRLDSIYGSGPIRLSFARSGYFLNDFDPDADFQNRQRYYSDQGETFENSLVGEPIYEISSFRPSNSEVIYREKNEAGEMDTVTVSPRMRIHLPLEFFQNNIIDKQGSIELSNSNNFRNYIRGLYIMAEPVNDGGTMFQVDITDSDAGITMYYTNTNEVDDTEEENSFKINFGPGVVNTFDQELPAEIEQEIEASNSPPGAENLYLRGGEGSMAVIELFEDEAELEQIKANDWLINEASINFYVNQELVPGGDSEPRRIYLYDLDNNELLFDYRIDPNVEAENPEIALNTHAPLLVRDEDGNGIYYKIRVTEHLKRVLNEDIENPRLGLVVTQNIQAVTNARFRTPIGPVERVPSGAVISPKGTVLHGNLSPDAAKRLKFNIYYTETSN